MWTGCVGVGRCAGVRQGAQAQISTRPAPQPPSRSRRAVQLQQAAVAQVQARSPPHELRRADGYRWLLPSGGERLSCAGRREGSCRQPSRPAAPLVLTTVHVREKESGAEGLGESGSSDAATGYRIGHQELICWAFTHLGLK
jgi:hypothetical protein